MTRSDVLHSIAALQADERVRQCITHGVTDLERSYVDYCVADRVDPSLRDYAALRRWLAGNVANHRSELLTVAQKAAAFFARNGFAPEQIYDIGAGHAEWAKVLKAAWPNAAVTLVDRFAITGTDFPSTSIDALQFLRTFKQTAPTLLFMSEWVHCKIDNLRALSMKACRDCAVFVVELDQAERAVDARLRKSGGRTMSPEEVIAARGTGFKAVRQDHIATFRYWSVAMTPAR